MLLPLKIGFWLFEGSRALLGGQEMPRKLQKGTEEDAFLAHPRQVRRLKMMKYMPLTRIRCTSLEQIGAGVRWVSRKHVKTAAQIFWSRLQSLQRANSPEK